MDSYRMPMNYTASSCFVGDTQFLLTNNNGAVRRRLWRPTSNISKCLSRIVAEIGKKRQQKHRWRLRKTIRQLNALCPAPFQSVPPLGCHSPSPFYSSHLLHVLYMFAAIERNSTQRRTFTVKKGASDKAVKTITTTAAKQQQQSPKAAGKSSLVAPSANGSPAKAAPFVVSMLSPKMALDDGRIMVASRPETAVIDRPAIDRHSLPVAPSPIADANIKYY